LSALPTLKTRSLANALAEFMDRPASSSVNSAIGNYKRSQKVPAKIMSNSVMDIPFPIENRLVDLEIKAGFTEDLLDQLNAQVYRQQQQIDALIQELRQMRDRLPESGGGAELRNLRDEIPPHY
jgi:SlyX protein